MRFKRSAAAASALLLTLLILVSGCTSRRDTTAKEPDSPRLAKSRREDRNGWVFVHLEGSPRDIGYQRGWHLAAETDDLLAALSFYLEKSSNRPWSFFREAAERMFWPKLDAELREEIEGTVEGLQARRPGAAWDRIDVTALNGWIELAWYYVPYLAEKTKPGSADNKAPAYCSAFIATGSYTADGRIVMAHNSWVEYIVGERWNVVADIVPAKGRRMLMDALPGSLHSGDDFVINDAGLVYTETTISQFKGFREDGTPEFARARRAAQYAETIDDFVRIMTGDNNGAYANDWLVGDLKTQEIARLELGLKNQRVWRTRDGYYAGANFPSDEKLIAEETTFDPGNASLSVLIRKARWEKLLEEYKGEVDAEDAKLFEADHIDAGTGRPASNGNVLCGHVDEDALGLPEFTWAPYFPGGSVQGKVTTAELAGKLAFWGRMGHPCGRPFLAEPFFRAHPEFAWQKKFLKDMPGHPWTLFEAGR